MPTENKTSIDYDTHWKEIISNLFEDFIAFFLKEAYPLIDFKKPAVFLEQELHKILSDNEKKGKKVNDKLVKVYLKDGSEKWILIHIEVQSSYEKDFTERMFTYFYRIYDQFSQKITAIAIYTGQRIPKKHDRFEYNFLGTTAFFQFNTYLVRAVSQEKLLESNNPFALVVLATKYLHKTKKDKNKRLEFKKELIKLAKEKNYTSAQIVNLLRFIALILVLPEELEKQFAAEISELFIKSKDMQAYKSEALRNEICLAVYGETLAVRDARLLKEERERAEKEREKERAAREKGIESLLRLGKLNLTEIAEAFNVSTNFVKEIQRKM